jgi:hypothetical protein
LSEDLNRKGLKKSILWLNTETHNFKVPSFLLGQLAQTTKLNKKKKTPWTQSDSIFFSKRNQFTKIEHAKLAPKEPIIYQKK